MNKLFFTKTVIGAATVNIKMTNAKRFYLLLFLFAFAASVSGCSPGTASLLYCLAVDHDINRKCQ